MARQINAVASVPVTIVGGAGSFKDMAELVRNFGIIGAGAGSMFVFKGVFRAVLVTFPTVVERVALFRCIFQAK